MKTHMWMSWMYHKSMAHYRSYGDIPLWIPKKLPNRNVITDEYYYKLLHRFEICIKGLKELHESESKRREFSRLYGKSKLASLYGEMKRR